MALRVAGGIAAVAEGERDELLDDLRALRLGAVVVGVDVLDDHVQHRRAADLRRVAIARGRLAGVDAAAELRLEFEVHAARGADLPVDLTDPERARHELGRGLAVLVEQVGRDRLHQPFR